MNYFCLIFPDAVYKGVSGKIVSCLSRAGVEISQRVVRKLTLEEVQTIFYARRLNEDFEQFCKAMMLSNVWLLNLYYEEDLAEALRKYLNINLIGEIFIPSSPEDNANFLRLVGEPREANDTIEEIASLVREKLAEKDHQEDLFFTSQAMKQGELLYSYYVAMRVNGFDTNQAFELTRGAQMAIFDSENSKVLLDDEEDDGEDSDFDDTGIDDDDDGSDA